MQLVQYTVMSVSGHSDSWVLEVKSAHRINPAPHYQTHSSTRVNMFPVQYGERVQQRFIMKSDNVMSVQIRFRNGMVLWVGSFLSFCADARTFSTICACCDLDYEWQRLNVKLFWTD